MIYFDNASTTIPSKEVLEEFISCASNSFANPSSLHYLGMKNENEISRIKTEILNLLKLNVSQYDVIFTSGATESNNLAIFGTCRQYKNRGNHIITTKIEHESVLNPFKEFEKEGFKVTYLDVDEDGKINIDYLKSLITKDTIFISIMGVNNEVGNILNIEEIKEAIKAYPKIIFHSDLAQSIGKVKQDYRVLDIMTLSSHKIHGLKGVGCLIKKKNIVLKPLIYGGEQQNNIRSGTIDFPNIVGFKVALKDAISNFNKHQENVKKVYVFLYESLKSIDSIEINSKMNWCPYILSISLKNKKASVVIEGLSNKEIYVNGVSACNSKKNEPSYVLKAFNKDDTLAFNPIRISLSYLNTVEEAKVFIEEFKSILSSIRGETR